MSALLAMGFSTTTDDRGYFLWLAQNWPTVAILTLALSALLVSWIVQRIRAWTGSSPGSQDGPGLVEGPGAPPQPPQWPFVAPDGNHHPMASFG